MDEVIKSTLQRAESISMEVILFGILAIGAIVVGIPVLFLAVYFWWVTIPLLCALVGGFIGLIFGVGLDVVVWFGLQSLKAAGKALSQPIEIAKKPKNATYINKVLFVEFSDGSNQSFNVTALPKSELGKLEPALSLLPTESLKAVLADVMPRTNSILLGPVEVLALSYCINLTLGLAKDTNAIEENEDSLQDLENLVREINESLGAAGLPEITTLTDLKDSGGMLLKLSSESHTFLSVLMRETVARVFLNDNPEWNEKSRLIAGSARTLLQKLNEKQVA